MQFSDIILTSELLIDHVELGECFSIHHFEFHFVAVMEQRLLPPFLTDSLTVTRLPNATYELTFQPMECYKADIFDLWNTQVRTESVARFLANASKIKLEIYLLFGILLHFQFRHRYVFNSRNN